MLAVLGFIILAAFLYATMTKKLSVPVALVLIPVVGAIIGGFDFALGKMMLDGILKVTPSAMDSYICGNVFWHYDRCRRF